MSDRPDNADSRVTAKDLEESFSRLTGESDEGPVPIQRPVIVFGAAVVSGLLVLAFLLGRRLGHKRSTFVEIVRV
jgi:hypothetical protein